MSPNIENMQFYYVEGEKSFLPVLIILTVFCLGLSPVSNVAVQADNTQGMVVVTGNEAEKLVDAMLHAVEEGEVENIAPVSAFDFDGLSVYTVGDGVTVVTIPLHGDYSFLSNITVFFDENDTRISYITDEEMLAEEPVGSGIQPMGIGEVVACLGAVLGIGGTVAYMIAVACGDSCTVPLLVTAPICAAYIGDGSIAGAVACFNYL